MLVCVIVMVTNMFSDLKPCVLSLSLPPSLCVSLSLSLSLQQIKTIERYMRRLEFHMSKVSLGHVSVSFSSRLSVKSHL